MRFNIFSVAALVFLISSVARPQAPLVETDVISALDQAQTAYYEARFTDTITILASLNEWLDAGAGHVEQRVRVKLQLALAHIALGDLSNAKTRFFEIHQVSSQFELDPGEFSPKVLRLFEEVKAESRQTTCRLMCERADAALKSSDAQTIFNTLTETASCSCMAARTIKAADVIYREALEAYKRGELAQALSAMRMVLKLDPEHHLASQYADLIDDRLKLSIDAILLGWQRQFETGQFPQAAESYNRLLLANVEGKAVAALDTVRAEYKKALRALAHEWSEACRSQDKASMDRLRGQAQQFVPDPSIANDVMDEMSNCRAQPERPTPPEVRSSYARGTEDCIQSLPQVALSRLKSRVEPKLPAESGKTGVTKVRATIRIDEQGNARVQQLYGGSPVANRAVVAAVKEWKFHPAVVDNHPRCVETELPIVLTH